MENITVEKLIEEGLICMCVDCLKSYETKVPTKCAESLRVKTSYAIWI